MIEYKVDVFVAVLPRIMDSTGLGIEEDGAEAVEGSEQDGVEERAEDVELKPNDVFEAINLLSHSRLRKRKVTMVRFILNVERVSFLSCCASVTQKKNRNDTLSTSVNILLHQPQLTPNVIQSMGFFWTRSHCALTGCPSLSLRPIHHDVSWYQATCLQKFCQSCWVSTFSPNFKFH